MPSARATVLWALTGIKLLAVPVQLILRIEQGTALLVALEFKRLDLLLPGELFLQSESQCGSATSLD